MSGLTSSVQHCLLAALLEDRVDQRAGERLHSIYYVPSVFLHFIAFLLCACEFGNQVGGVLLIVPSERTLRMLLVGFGTWPTSRRSRERLTRTGTRIGQTFLRQRDAF